MIFALFLSLTTLASPGELSVVPLKSGAYVHLQPASADHPGQLTFVHIGEEGDTSAWVCPIQTADRWRAWGGFFQAIAAESLPTRVQASGEQPCSAVASYTNGTKDPKIVELTVRHSAATEALFTSSLSRREATDLATRLLEVADLPEPMSHRAASSDESQTAQTAVRILYLARGWDPRPTDPGWKADLDAARALIEAQKDVAAAIHRAIGERKLRPGALADVLLDTP